jgi:hypothetical protein
MPVRPEDIASIAGFLGWYSLEGAGGPPAAGAVDVYENAILGCAFSRKLSPAERDLVRDFIQGRAPAGADCVWDGSQQGWKLWARVRVQVAVRFGKPLLEMSARRVAKLREILGEERLNRFSAFAEELVFPFSSNRAETESLALYRALHAADFDVQLTRDTSYGIARHVEGGTPTLMTFEDEEARARLVRRMLDAGVPVEHADAEHKTCC